MDTLLKKIRNERKQTTYEVAALLGISQGTYHHIEQGHRTVDVDLAKKIAGYCGVPLERACIIDSCRYRVADGIDPRKGKREKGLRSKTRGK